MRSRWTRLTLFAALAGAASALPYMRWLVGGAGMDFTTHLGLAGVVQRSGELVPLGPGHEYLLGPRVFTGYMGLPHVVIGWLAHAVGLLTAFKLYAVLAFAVAGSSAAMLARRLAMPASAALLAAVYVVCSYPYTRTLIVNGEVPHLMAYALVPVFIALVIDACRAPGYAARPVAAAALALAATILCHPTVATRGALSTIAVLAVLFLARGFTRRGLGQNSLGALVLRGAAVGAIALALTGWRLFPTLGYFAQMGHTMTRAPAVDGAVADFFTRALRVRFWIPVPATLYLPYVGVSVLAVVALALLSRRRWAAGLAGATGALLACGWASFQLWSRALVPLLPFSGMEAQAPRFPNYMVIGAGLLFGAAAHAARPPGVRRARWTLAMAALIAVDLWSLRYGFTHFWPKFEGSGFHDALTRTAALDLPPGRLLVIHAMNLKLSAPAFVPRSLANVSFPDLAPAALAAHAIWLQAGLATAKPFDAAPHLDLFAVDTVIVYEDAPADRAVFDAGIVRMTALGWPRALEGPPPGWKPPHRTDPGRYVVFTRPRAPAGAIRAWETPLALDTGRPPAQAAAGHPAPSPIPVTIVTRERLSIEAPPGGFRAPLRVSLAYDPWWHAADDTGAAVSCRLAQSGMLALEPRAGVRRVVLTWEPPPAVRLMIWFAVFTLVASASVLFAGKK